jgi:hypothetical protein
VTVLAAAAPLHRTSPGWSPSEGWTVPTAGHIATSVGADLGLTPDDEQQWLLDAIYAVNDRGLPAAYEVNVTAPRQNLKSATLEIAALTDLFVFGVDLAVWTAHEFKTARKTFLDMRRRIMGHPDYAARATFEMAHGKEAITLDTGERLEFHARSQGSGRGFTCRKITLDEWLFGQPGDLGALVPTLFTIEDAQIRYGSSAGKVNSAALRDLRARGRAGDPSLAYVEYGATRRPCELGDRCPHQPVDEVPGCALDDRELWWQANCALWAGRATLASVEKMRRSLPPLEFMREFFSWWEDPPNLAGDGDLDMARWGTLVDTAAAARKPLVVGVDQGEDRTVSIGCAWRRPDGDVQVMLGQDADEDGVLRVDAGLSPGTAVARIVELRKRHSARVLLGGPALGSLGPALTEAGVPIETVTSSEFATACGQVEDRMRAGTIHHGGQSELTDSVAVAKWRSVGKAGEREFQLAGVPGIGPTAAVVRALHGLTPTSKEKTLPQLTFGLS